MIVKPQKVEVKWHSGNINHYVKLDYKYTKIGDAFKVDVDDLMVMSDTNIIVDCDYCHQKFRRRFSRANSQKRHLCSNECKNKSGFYNTYTKEYLKDMFWEYYNKNKQFPLAKDLDEDENYPHHTAYVRAWGSWNDFLKSIGVLGENGWYKCDEDVLRKYYENHDKQIILDSLMIKRSWETIVMKANSMNLYRSNDIRYKDKYNKNDLVIIAKSFYDRFKITPRMNKDLNINIIHIRKYWSNYNEFLKECNIPIVRINLSHISKKDGIDILIKLAKDLKRVPTVFDVQNFTDLNKGWYKNKFGSFKHALVEAELISRNELNSVDQKIEDSVNGLRKIFEDKKQCPTFSDYSKYATKYKLLSPNTLKLYLNKGFVDICKTYLGVSNYLDAKSEKDIITDLKYLKKQLNRTPTIKEVKENLNISNYQMVKVFNKTYGQITEELGWESERHYYKTNDELLEDYWGLYLQLKRPPLPEDINENRRMASYPTYKDRFGNIFEICNLLNIEYKNDILVDKKGRKIYIDKNGEICRSYPEKVISDLLIDNEIDNIKEFEYKNIFNNKKDKRRMDWYLVDENICVEYFGLYDEKYLNKKDRIGMYTKKTIKKINDCKENNQKLISLFIDDLDNNFYGLINKFLEFDIKIHTALSN